MLARVVAVALAAVFPFAVATPLYKFNRRSDGLSVALSAASSTEVKAVLSNTGSEAVRLLTLGTFLDDTPVQSLAVSQDGENVEYTGLLLNYLQENLPEESFITLQPGETAEGVVNLPAFYSVTGGTYEVSIADTFAFASAGSTTLEGVYEFSSNSITIDMEPEAVASVAQAVSTAQLDRRTQMLSCSGSQATALRNAISATNRLATGAASAASGGSSTKFNEYFRTTAATTRSNVASRFRSIATESASTTSGRTTYSCTDYAGICSQGSIIAYAQPATNRIANCPLFYSLRATSTGCNQQSQASTVLHEMTHCSALFSPATQDYAYGYTASVRLSASQAYQNADTYALYADAIANGC